MHAAIAGGDDASAAVRAAVFPCGHDAAGASRSLSRLWHSRTVSEMQTSASTWSQPRDSAPVCQLQVANCELARSASKIENRVCATDFIRTSADPVPFARIFGCHRDQRDAGRKSSEPTCGNHAARQLGRMRIAK